MPDALLQLAGRELLDGSQGFSPADETDEQFLQSGSKQLFRDGKLDPEQYSNTAKMY